MNDKHIEIFEDNPTYEALANMRPPIRYSEAHEDCVLHIIEPWKQKGVKRKNPLIVFVQGSGWTHPNAYLELPQLSAYARAGYVVASVVHRNAVDGFPFPAFLTDVKTAIRYMRANADDFDIDVNRVCIWGTSSGGNAALLVGATGDDERYKTHEYANQSDAVSVIIDCFGPSDLPAFDDADEIIAQASEPFASLMRGHDPQTVVREMSPVYQIHDGMKYPPTLIIQGDADPVVPYSQSLTMHERLLEIGCDSTLIRVTNAVHEGNTWSTKLHERIERFLKEKL